MENYFMNYDEATGEIKGFYLKSIHENIPSPNIEITPERHDFYMQNNGKYKININTLENELLPIIEANQEYLIKAELLSLDNVLPRATEDLIAAINLDVAKLPQIMQDRLNRKIELRNQLKAL